MHEHLTQRPRLDERRRSSGATLIEVLVAIAITSIGLLGMAGLMIVSAKLDREAYLGTQASFIAQTLIESMHINAPAVVQGRYDGIYSGRALTGPDCLGQGCSPAQRADYDRARFDNALRTTLPNANADMTCVGGRRSIATAASIYDGTCRLEIRWSEHARDTSITGQVRSLAWTFRP